MLAQAGTDILARLRAETRPHHEALERDLGWAEETPARSQVVEALTRFHGFFAAWEPALAAILADEDFLAPRRKLPLLRRDLQALGISEADIRSLPVHPHPAPFRCQAGAIGSLYVVEGSTLGGQIITRRLKGAPWLPEGGLTYFRSYGPQVGAMWRAFLERLERTSSAVNDHRIVGSAALTFQRLNSWLCRGL